MVCAGTWWRAGRQARRALALGTALACLLAVAAAGVGSSSAQATGRHGAASPLAFDLPPRSVLRSSPRLVFAHYWPPMTVSLDDRRPATDFYQENYLNPASNYPTGSAAFGGLLRDRPMARSPRGTGWRLADLEAEVRQAASAGLDGFMLDIMQLPGDPDVNQVATVRTMMAAAAAVDPGFRIVPQLDMGGSLQAKTPAQLASFVAELAASPAAMRLADGRLVVSAFLAEKKPVEFWKSFLSVMSASYGLRVAFAPTLLDEVYWAPAFAPISWMIGNWGSRNPAWNDPTLTYSTGPVGRARRVRGLGVKWMQPVSFQDSRPRSGVFDEAGNTENLRDSWQVARDGGATWVQLTTWNDYTENTAFAPSARHGWSVLDIDAYYLAWFKTGRRPVIRRDTVYLTHRTQPWAAAPAYPQTVLQRLRGGTPARDTVEALTFLTAPATVTVTVGGVPTRCAAPAGVSACVAPLRPGTASATVTRDRAETAQVTSPYPVTSAPFVQDLTYVASSSRRADPASPARAPCPSASTSLAPVADSYANQGAPDTAFGTTSSLASRGAVGAVAYLRFDLPAAPTGCRLAAASLRLRTTDDSWAGTDLPHPVRLAGNGWSETGLTWASRPATSRAVGQVPAGTGAGQVVAVPLDAGALAAGPAGRPVTLAVAGDGTDNLWFWSRQRAGTGFAPALRLEYRASHG